METGTETETVDGTEEAPVSGRAGAGPHPVESLEIQETVCERRDGTWMSCPNLRKTFMLNILKCSE